MNNKLDDIGLSLLLAYSVGARPISKKIDYPIFSLLSDQESQVFDINTGIPGDEYRKKDIFSVLLLPPEHVDGFIRYLKLPFIDHYRSNFELYPANFHIFFAMLMYHYMMEVTKKDYRNVARSDFEFGLDASLNNFDMKLVDFRYGRLSCFFDNYDPGATFNSRIFGLNYKYAFEILVDRLCKGMLNYVYDVSPHASKAKRTLYKAICRNPIVESTICSIEPDFESVNDKISYLRSKCLNLIFGKDAISRLNVLSEVTEDGDSSKVLDFILIPWFSSLEVRSYSNKLSFGYLLEEGNASKIGLTTSVNYNINF